MKKYYLALKGDIDAGADIISLLKDLGASNNWQYTGQRSDWVYSMGGITSNDIRAFKIDDVVKNPEFCIFSYEDFIARFHLKQGDSVMITGYPDQGEVIGMAWSNILGDMSYKVHFKERSIIGWWYWRDLSEIADAPIRHGEERPQQPRTEIQPLMDFGNALSQLKLGKKISRRGWNGKGMYLWLKPAITIKSEWCKDSMLKEIVDANGGETETLGTICMKTADNKILTGWLANQSDMLADDWYIV